MTFKMARPLRIEYEGAFYHVINRGNAGEDIFISDRDHEKFLEYLETAVERFSINIHTYCLMTNHYHLLIETPHANLSKAIQWINVSYSVYFNRKRKRSGHLFQGRFKSILVEADEYLKHLSRYIHLNPVRAGMVGKPSDYRWSSYLYFIGNSKTPAWFERKWLLSQFGKSLKAAAVNYKKFVESININTLENPAKHMHGGFILGSSDFVQWVKNTFLVIMTGEKEISELRKIGPLIEPKVIVEQVSENFKCDIDSILQKGRKNNIARDVAIYLSKKLSGETSIKLGEYFGNISGANITGRSNYIQKEIEKTKRLKTRVNKLCKLIIDN